MTSDMFLQTNERKSSSNFKYRPFSIPLTYLLINSKRQSSIANDYFDCRGVNLCENNVNIRSYLLLLDIIRRAIAG